MSDDYTPTTEEVRDRFWINDGAWADPDDAEAFDRWLAAHDAEVRADQIKNDAMAVGAIVAPDYCVSGIQREAYGWAIRDATAAILVQLGASSAT